MSKKNRIIISCRLAYVNCWKPASNFGKQAYSLVAIIPKTDAATLDRIWQTINYVKEKSVEKFGGRIPPNCHIPLHDGDIEKPDNPVFRNSYYLNAKCKDAPQIVDHNVRPITEPNELYSGCFGNISLIFYAYNCAGSKGIGVWLGNIQKLKDGPRLNGRISAEEEFQPVTYDEILSQEAERI